MKRIVLVLTGALGLLALWNVRGIFLENGPRDAGAGRDASADLVVERLEEGTAGR